MRKNIVTKKMLSLITVFSIVIFSFFNTQILAEERNSITVQTKFENMQNKGISLELYRIGIVKSNQIVLREELKDININFGNMSASHMLHASKVISENIKDKNILYKIKTIDSRGTVVFDNLEDGVYLVKQSSMKEVNGKKYMINPFIVLLPYHFQGQEIYDVEAFAKPEIIDPPEVTPGGDPDNPKPPDEDKTPGKDEENPQDNEDDSENPDNPNKKPNGSNNGGNRPGEPSKQTEKPKTGDSGISKPIGILLISSALLIYINRKR